jgi:hypothetical protein
MDDIESMDPDTLVNGKQAHPIPLQVIQLPRGVATQHIRAVEIEMGTASSTPNGKGKATVSAKSADIPSGMVNGYGTTLTVEAAREILSDPALFLAAAERLVDSIGV